MHVAAGGARLVVADEAHGILDSHGLAGAQALAGDAAAADFIGLTLATGALPAWRHL